MVNRHLQAVVSRRGRTAAALGAAAAVTLGHAGGAGALEAKYDSLNRLVESTSGSVTETYKYDGWGNLVETCRSVSGAPATCTEHIVDEVAQYPRIVADIPVGGGDTRYYAYDLTGLAAVKTGTGGVEVAAKDHAGSVRAFVDGDGDVTDRRAYDAFGARRAPVAAGAAPYGYTGERETGNGLVYLRARHYAPEMGRFLQRDTFAGVLQRPTSLNRYVYAEANPLNMVDPSGHMPVLLAWGLVVMFTSGAALPWVMMGGQGVICQSMDPAVCQDPEVRAYMDAEFGRVNSLAQALQEIGGAGVDISMARRIGLPRSSHEGWPCSFEAGTPVETRDGPKAIEELRVGDEVLAEDERTGTIAYKRVTETFSTPDEEVVELEIEGTDGQLEVLHTTANHRVFTKDETGVAEWREVASMRAGSSRVLGRDGQWRVVRRIHATGREETMYNLEVSDFHTYFVGEMSTLVHNACPMRRLLGRELGRGSFKTIYEIHGNADNVVFELTRPDNLSLQQLQIEMQTLGAMKDMGIPIVELTLLGNDWGMAPKYLVNSKDPAFRRTLMGLDPAMRQIAIQDLQTIRSALQRTNMYVSDFQVALMPDGRVMVTDPVGINAVPSGRNPTVDTITRWLRELGSY